MESRTNALRWYLKKGARRAVAFGSFGSGVMAQSRRGSALPRVRALTYHRFGDADRDPFCVRTQDLEQQMAWLSTTGLAVSLADVEAFLRNEKPLADGSILVTVDDGAPSLLSHGLPIFRRYQIPAVAFIPAGEVVDGDANRGLAVTESPHARLSWTELEAIVAAGITIGSHAWTHRSLGAMAPDQLREQAERSRAVLERRTGQRVTSFAYPFGTRADYNAETVRALEHAAYVCAFTSQHGAIQPGVDAFTLPRIKVEGGESLAMFRLLVHGALDAWRWVDRALWRVQARGA